jgi:aryl-alcohol dehydrogenase-like predicted oxidoreductase
MKNHIESRNAGVRVSRLSFGTVFMGPQSDDMSPEERVALLLHAFKQGVLFWDTSHPPFYSLPSKEGKNRFSLA